MNGQILVGYIKIFLLLANESERNQKRLLWKPKVYVVGKQCESIVWLSKNSDIVEGGTRRLLRIQAQVSVPHGLCQEGLHELGIIIFWKYIYPSYKHEIWLQHAKKQVYLSQLGRS